MKKTILITVVVAVVLLGTGAAVRASIQRSREKARNNKFSTPEKQLAAMFHSAMYPLGESAWVTWAYNVDEEELIRMAVSAQGMGTRMEEVAETYSEMYGRDMVKDIKRVMNNPEMARFFQSIEEGRFIA